MYRIIGADGKEYGPVTADQLRLWRDDGRVSGQTLVQVDGTGEWHPLEQLPHLTTGVVPPAPPRIADLQNDDWLHRHFRRHEQRPAGAFLRRVLLEQLLVTGVLGTIAILLGIPSKDYPDSDLPVFFVTAVAIAPWLETLLFQMLPVSVARACGGSRRTQIAVSAALFALPHFAVSPFTGLTAGLIGGFYFAFTYTHWRRQSLSRAFWMTVAQHALYNTALAIIVFLALLAG